MDTAPTIVLVIVLVSLLAVIAFSSGTEVAMLSVNRYRVRTRALAGERRAKLLEKLLAEPDGWLGANLVLLALASSVASSVTTLLALRADHPYALPVMTIVALPLVMIVFCELAPKIFSAAHSEPVALGSAYVYRVLLLLTSPVIWFTNRAARGFLRLVGMRPAPMRSAPTNCAPWWPNRARWCRRATGRCCCRSSTSSASP